MPARDPIHPSAYERRALEEIEAWRHPEPSWWDGPSERIGKAWNGVTDMALKIPGVEWTIENVITGILELTNEITQDSVWVEGIYRDFERCGHSIAGPDDLLRLDLSDIDGALDGLELKYQALAGAEGAATGFAGAAGIVPDLVALVSLNLRAAGEFATYCSFDMRQPAERLYALQLMDQVATSGEKRKDLAFAPAVRMASRAARTQGYQAIQQAGITEAIERVTRALGLHLTGSKMAGVVPVAGAVYAGGFNIHYTRQLCRSARYLYRERYLVKKYGKRLNA